MRLRSTILPLAIAAIVSCQSTDKTNNSDVIENEIPQITDSETSAAPNAPVVRAIPASAQGTDDEESMNRAQAYRQSARDKAAVLVDNGRVELAELRLEDAIASFAAALQLDPTNQDARTELRTVRSMMGDKYANVGEAFADETDRAMVRRAQALLQVEAFSDEGDRAFETEDYDRAVEQYRQAKSILRWHPTIESENLDLIIVKGKIDMSIQEREAKAEREAKLEHDDAQALQLKREAEEIERRENKLRDYYELANHAFLAENYSQAETWCRLILLEDPGNDAAVNLRSTAREARHSSTEESNRKHYREQWLRTFEDLDTMNVPQTESLKFALDRWKSVRQRKPLAHNEMDPGAVRERDAVLTQLDSIRIEPNFGGADGEGSPLEEVASYLQSFTGVNFFISNTVTDELDEEETNIVLQLPERSVRKVLDIITETRENLRWMVEDGVVKFITAEELIGGQILRTYSVHDLVHPIQDYPGREMNVAPSGAMIELDEELEERETNVVTTSMLEELIRNNIAVDSWDNDPANSIRITDTGQMVVNQVPEVQDMIQHLLDDLREATGIMVDIQARFMKVEDNFLEDIGVDFRGLGSPGLGESGRDFNDFGDASTQQDLGGSIGQGTDLGAFYNEGADGDIRARVEELYDLSLGNDQVLQGSGGLSFQWTFLNDLQLELILRAVSKSERVELVTAPRILVHNTARANLSVLNQVAYVRDYDVEIAQAAAIADPIIGVIQDGVILDVRPTVSADRRFITLEMRPTIAELKRPIIERPTTLGTQNSVTIQLPEVEFQRVRTTIPIPDGGTVLLGGMKVSEKEDLRSGVPILNKIPLLSALFERKGNYVSNRKLLILLRAAIVIPEEKEPKASEFGEE
ncbi:MAG: hypothetical protein ACI835_000035 [Planctomycetota bacterium]|jgi:hypothetical protein